eukprot:m.158531 g.158531  ORF g.158531 m.158531 type:complete len:337 (-) comp10248_c0_seq3:1056-2066(-)
MSSEVISCSSRTAMTLWPASSSSKSSCSSIHMRFCAAEAGNLSIVEGLGWLGLACGRSGGSGCFCARLTSCTRPESVLSAKKLLRHNVHTQGRCDTRQHLHGKQRVPTKLKEPALHTQLFQRQHITPDATQKQLQLGAWLDKLAGDPFSHRDMLHLNSRLVHQPRTVHFAIGCGWQLGELNDAIWHGIARDARTHLTLDRMGVQLLVAGHKAKELVNLFAHDHGSTLHKGAARKLCLDTFQLETLAADLDLVVDASSVEVVTGGVLYGNVACAVETTKLRMNDEAACSFLRCSDVACSHTGTANVQDAGAVWRHKLQVTVEDVRLGVGNRCADRDV